MKRVGCWALTIAIFMSQSVFSLSTTPSNGTVAPVAGPFLITSYSYSGNAVRYLQIYNSSNELRSLDGWSLQSQTASETKTYPVQLSGRVEPGKYVTIGSTSSLPSATFTYQPLQAVDVATTAVTLLPPTGSGFVAETVAPTVTSTTPRVSGQPATFYFSRNISTTTGNYLTSFAAFVPSASYAVLSDALYQPPTTTALRVVEIFSDAAVCAPNETDLQKCQDYVKLYNPGPTDIDMSRIRVRTGSYNQASTSSNTARPTGIVRTGEYVTVYMNLSSLGSWVWLEDAYGVQTFADTLTAWPSSSGHDHMAWSLDFGANVWKWTSILTPGNIPNQFDPVVAVNQCAGLRLSEIAANVDLEDQFVEIENATSQTIDLTGCALQTNRSQTVSFRFGQETLEAGQRMVIYIKDTDLTLTKTTTGTVYVLSSNLANEVDARSYEDMPEGTSLALLDGHWVQTYHRTPAAQNDYLQYLPCEAGYERNLTTGLCNKLAKVTTVDCAEGKILNADTNRCRNIVTTASTLASCEAGQYRNPETNRCRSIAASTTSSMQQCGVGQIRNPETNRCRSATSQANSLQPCAAGQERNPETNRCRKTSSSAATADFPAEAVGAAGNGGVAWWAFGGAGILAAGYAGWEWRREVVSAVKKAASFVASGR